MSEDGAWDKIIQEAGGVDAFLRSRGYDPNEVATLFRAVAERTLEEQDILTVWRWVKKYGGDINCTSIAQHIVVLGVRHMYAYQYKDFANIRAAANWIREQEDVGE